MRRSTPALLVALAVLLSPHAVHAGIAIEGLYGFARPPDANFSAAISGAANDKDLSESSLQIAGATRVRLEACIAAAAVVRGTAVRPDAAHGRRDIGMPVIP